MIYYTQLKEVSQCIIQANQRQRTANQNQRASQSQRANHQQKKRSKPNILAFYTSNEEIT